LDAAGGPIEEVGGGFGAEGYVGREGEGSVDTDHSAGDGGVEVCGEGGALVGGDEIQGVVVDVAVVIDAEPFEAEGKKSPWVWVGIGCGGVVVVIAVALLVGDVHQKGEGV
jgi:hypothetical protein